MSRSYKRPYFTQPDKARKIQKRHANKKVRKAKDLSNGSAYKLHKESWDICDWKFYRPEQAEAYRK